MTVTLPNNTVKVILLHYSTVRSAWETIPAESFDIATGKIVVKMADFSPVMVLAQTQTTTQQPDDSQDSDDQTSEDQTTEEPAAPEAPATSPKTGAVSTWALWMGAAAVLTATGSAVCKRRR